MASFSNVVDRGFSGSPARCSSLSRREDGAPMTLELYQIVVDSREPSALAKWWCQVLGMEVLLETSDEVVIGTGPDLWLGLVSCRSLTTRP
jgi:hypothetical protein